MWERWLKLFHGEAFRSNSKYLASSVYIDNKFLSTAKDIDARFKNSIAAASFKQAKKERKLKRKKERKKE